ncbi:MAG: endolytic transglycosylase MltG [Gemmatimonadaceae bacterium]
MRPATATLLALSLAGGVNGCGDPTGNAVQVVIPAGSTFKAATDSLSAHEIIAAPLLFRMYAKVTGDDRSLKAGTYLLRPGMTWNGVLDALTEGRGVARMLTIPEGYALRDIVPLLVDSLGLPADSVWAAVRDTVLLRELGISSDNLEGYLFPETYSFAAGSPAGAVVDRMVREFGHRWKPEWNSQLAALDMTRHEIVTLASIVEKEAILDAERPMISAVYHNRLRIGMPLQADPTVQYAQGRHSKRVLYSDLEIDSPYNTYRRRGLPPGPIASPGAASLEAALFPADVPYRYFVAHPDGHHEFRVTFEGHTDARRDVRRAGGDADGGTPEGAKP